MQSNMWQEAVEAANAFISRGCKELPQYELVRKHGIALYHGLVKESWVTTSLDDYEVLINHLKQWYCDGRRGLTIKVVGVMKDFVMPSDTATPSRGSQRAPLTTQHRNTATNR